MSDNKPEKIAMKVLLTGASGFLGRHFRLLEATNELVTVGRSTGNTIVWDIFEPYSGDSLIEVDRVVHVAGHAHIYPRTDEEKARFYQVNLEGTKNLVRSLDSRTVQQFVFISTVAVYGVETGEDITEEYQTNPNSPYGESKLLAEQFLRTWGEQNGVKVLILRLPLIVGDNPPGNLGRMISSIRRGRYMSINQGRAKRSAVLASDVVRLIANGEEYQGTYNLTDHVDPTFRDFEVKICEQLGKSLSPSLPLWFAHFVGRIGDLIPGFPLSTSFVKKMSLHFTVSCDKAIRELNWKPQPVINHIKIDT